MKKLQDDALVGADAFRVFAQDFGQDQYSVIILEELLKVLLGVKEENNEEPRSN